jgi:hypothetical protein
MKIYGFSKKKEEATRNAYEHWEKNPYLLKVDLELKFDLNTRDLALWMKQNGKARPDGRKIGKGSDRQQVFKQAYEAAVAGKHDIRWAVAFARKLTTSVGPGDLRYYGMKNGLPDLPEPASQYQTSPNKVQL